MAAEPGPDPYDDMPPLVDVDDGLDGDEVTDPLDDPTRTCFICLASPDEDPAATWVAPCPCTLTAHEDCLLQWIDGQDRAGAAVNEIVEDIDVLNNNDNNNNNNNNNDGRGRLRLRANRKVRCPACNAPIYTLESPPDFWVHLGDRMADRYRYYIAPHLLATMAGTMAIAGSSYYGFSMFMSVAGPDKVVAWLAGGGIGLGSNVMFAQRTSSLTSRLLSHPADVLWMNARMALLGLVAPTLLLQRAVPLIFYAISAPLTWAYGMEQTLVRYWRTRTLRGALAMEWPPSATTLLVAAPNMCILYSMLYNNLLGGLEQRLDRALGLIPEPYVAENVDAAADVLGAGADAAPAAAQANPGVFGYVRRLGETVVNIVRGHMQPDDHGQVIDERIEFQIEVVVGGGDGDGDDEAPGDGFDEAGEWDDMLGEAAAAPPDIGRQQQPQQQQQQPPAQQQQQQQPALQDNQIRLFPDQLSIRGIVAASTSQLLLPSIASSMGDLLWLVLPAAMTATKRYTWQKERFLGQRWARSLVGGALYIFVRDLLMLYGKYRRVQTRGQRMIRNCDRKQHRKQHREQRQLEQKREEERTHLQQLQRDLAAQRDDQGAQAVVEIEDI